MAEIAEETNVVENSDRSDFVAILSEVQFDWRIRIPDSAKERLRKMVLDVMKLETLKSTPAVAVVRRHGSLPAWDDLQIDVFDELGARICRLNTVKDVHGRIRLFA